MMRSLFNKFPALYFINWLAAYTEETLLSSSAATCAADSAESVVNTRIWAVLQNKVLDMITQNIPNWKSVFCHPSILLTTYPVNP